MRHHWWSPPLFFCYCLISLYCSGNGHPAAALLTFQGGMACPQLNSWRPGGEQDTEERSLASHREGDREWRKKREGGKRVERVREGSTGSISASHWRVRLRYPPPLQWHTLACSWPGGHMLAASYSMCTDHYCGHSTDGERKAHSDGRPERE